MIDIPDNYIPVFKSHDPDLFAKAAVTLKNAGIAFQAGESNERSSKVPWRCSYIMVRREHNYAARQALTNIPSEIILQQQPASISKSERYIAWIQVILLAALLLAGILSKLFYG